MVLWSLVCLDKHWKYKFTFSMRLILTWWLIMCTNIWHFDILHMLYNILYVHQLDYCGSSWHHLCCLVTVSINNVCMSLNRFIRVWWISMNWRVICQNQLKTWLADQLASSKLMLWRSRHKTTGIFAVTSFFWNLGFIHFQLECWIIDMTEIVKDNIKSWRSLLLASETNNLH